MLDRMGFDKSIGVNYSDFLPASLDSKIYLNKEKIWNAFKYFNIDNTNYITLAN